MGEALNAAPTVRASQLLAVVGWRKYQISHSDGILVSKMSRTSLVESIAAGLRCATLVSLIGGIGLHVCKKKRMNHVRPPALIHTQDQQ